MNIYFLLRSKYIFITNSPHFVTHSTKILQKMEINGRVINWNNNIYLLSFTFAAKAGSLKLDIS